MLQLQHRKRARKILCVNTVKKKKERKKTAVSATSGQTLIFAQLHSCEEETVGSLWPEEKLEGPWNRSKVNSAKFGIFLC